MSTPFIRPVATLSLLCTMLLAPLVTSAAVLPTPIKTLVENDVPLSHRIDFSGGADFTAEGEDIDFKLSGYQIVNFDEEPDTMGRFSLSLMSDTKGWTDMFGQKPFAFTLETRLINSEDLYFSISKMSKLSFWNVKPFLKKWVHVDLAETNESLGLVAEDAVSLLTSGEDLSAAYAKYPAFTFIESGSTASEYRYTYTADTRLLLKLGDEINGEVTPEEEITEIANMVPAVRGTIAITKATNRLASASVAGTVTEPESDLRGTFAVEAKFSKYGKSTRIKKPSGRIVPLEDFVQSVMESFLDSIFSDWDKK